MRLIVDQEGAGSSPVYPAEILQGECRWDYILKTCASQHFLSPFRILANAGWEYIWISKFDSCPVHLKYGRELSPILSPINKT